MNKKITVQTPTNQPIKYKQKNITEPTIEMKENSITYIWNLSYSPTEKKEISTDYNKIPAPRLEILPLSFKYDKMGSWESWKTFGNWIYELNKGRDVLPNTEQEKIKQLVNGINTEYDKIKILYYYLQDYTRYVNVVIKTGGLQTYPAEYVCNNRYGDCKALTNYMQAMLKHIGIKSYYTLIYSDDSVEDIDIDFPSQVFNHVY